MRRFLLFLLCGILWAVCPVTSWGGDDAKKDKLHEYYELIKNAGWGEEDQDSEHKKMFDEVEELINIDSQTLSDLKENAQAMKEKEQSLENKMLGAVGIGATGIGGMQLAQGLAEQNADAEAEAAMKAYLATFTCEYGSGRIAGGTQNVELPGTNLLTPLIMEYKELAADLKSRKEALGMAPGIESETIFDAAAAGLYDDENLGKTGGAYASLSRALSGDADAAATWDAQKEESAKKVKTGAITAGVGAVGSLVGNLIVNKNSAKESSKDILARRDNIETELADLIKKTIEMCNEEIKKHQDEVKDIKQKEQNWEQDGELKAYVQSVEALSLLDADEDITKIKEHPVCW